MTVVVKSFAAELQARIAPDDILFFLRVEKRGLEFPLHGCSFNYRRVFLVPNMILAVIEENDDYLVVGWHGPTLQTEYKNHSSISPYSESISFTIDIACKFIENGSLVKITPAEVIKMPNHVPAVLY